LVVDQPSSEGSANLSRPVSCDSVYAFAPPSVALPAISSPCSAFSGSIAISIVSGPFGYANLDSKGLSVGVSPPPDSQKEVVLASPVDTPMFSAQPLVWFSKMGFGRRWLLRLQQM